MILRVLYFLTAFLWSEFALVAADAAAYCRGIEVIKHQISDDRHGVPGLVSAQLLFSSACWLWNRSKRGAPANRCEGLAYHQNIRSET